VAHKGWIGDAAWTYGFGEPTEEVRRLTECGKESIKIGIDRLRAGRPMIDWARALQHYVENECKLHLVRGLGGHGYGRKLHEPPFISNTVPTFRGEWPDAYKVFQPGMLLAVEPMIAVGTGRVVQESGGWPMYTADGSMSVHYEHDVLVTHDGPRVLTEGLDEIEAVITR
jgi:methionyl aminopeptidase